MTTISASPAARLVPGDLVEVRSAAQIRQTLDEFGCLDNMPFMPEMLPFCGRQFRVFKRADKTCDSISWTGLRRLDDTVHLAGLRCDGGAHGDCHAACLLYWKESWLKKIASANSVDASATPRTNGAASVGGEPDVQLVQLLEKQKVRTMASDGEPIYRCQATEIVRASRPLPWYIPGQYVRDMRDNGVSAAQVVSGLTLSLCNKVFKKLRLPTYPRVAGSLKKTPTENLGLQAGDWVEVKSHAEILKTLNGEGRNRGLTFDPEMTVYCGKRYPVLRIVERIVQEDTGRLVTLPGRCIILTDGVCTAVYHRFCPRSTYAYWREIWLKRVDGPQ